MQLITEVAVVRRSIPYCTSVPAEGNPQQQYDLYLPEHSDHGAVPVVVFVHGGGWVGGDKRNDLADYYGAALVKRGIAVASINYRLAPEFTYPTQNNDVACAIKAIAERADEFGLDPSRIGLFGDSAGGLLAAMYTLHQPADVPRIKGVVEFYGTADLSVQMNQFPHKRSNAAAYLGSRDAHRVQEASPVYQPIPPGTPPFLLFHGDRDGVVGSDQVTKFYQRLHAVNPKTALVVVRGAGHHFGSTGSPPPERIRDMLVAFFVRTL